MEITKAEAAHLNVSEDIEGASDRIIKSCLGVKRGDAVWLEAWDDVAPFLYGLEIACRKVGARPMLSLRNAIAVEKILSFETVESLTEYTDPLVDIVGTVNAAVSVGGPADPSFFKRVESGKLGAYLRRRSFDLFDRLRNARIPTAFPLLGIVTEERAILQRLEMDRFHAMMYRAMNVDYRALKMATEELSDKFRGAERIRLEAGNGTHLEFSVRGRAPYPNHGIIERTDIQHGRSWITLPAGSVSIPPVEDSAEGEVCFGGNFSFKGTLLNDIKFTFKEGRVIRLEADQGADVLKDHIEKAGGDSDRIGGLAIGLNPRQERIGLITDTTAAGTASIGIGLNNFIGGKNQGNFFYSFSVEKPSLYIDGKLILKGGDPAQLRQVSPAVA